MIEECRRKTIIALVLLHCVGCMVDAGNPIGEEGTIDVKFVNLSGDLGQSLSLGISSLELIGVDENEQVVQQELASSSETIDLLKPDSDSSILLSSQSVPSGFYNRLAINLTNTDSLKLVDNEGNSLPVNLEDSGTTTIYVDDFIIVSSSERAEIEIDLDLNQSLISQDEKGYVFKPRAYLNHRKRGENFNGSTDVVQEAQWVCAYLYEPIAPKDILDPELFKRFLGDGKLGGIPPHWKAMEMKKSFESKEDVIKDSDNMCDNAFSRVSVVDNIYRFNSLRPGTYDFRIFKKDGSFVDVHEGTRLAPSNKRGAPLGD